MPGLLPGGLAPCQTLPGSFYLLPYRWPGSRERAPDQQRTGLTHTEDKGHPIDEDHRREALIHLTAGSRLPIRLRGPTQER
jgi:hypothetical protein